MAFLASGSEHTIVSAQAIIAACRYPDTCAGSTCGKIGNDFGARNEAAHAYLHDVCGRI